MAWVRKYGGRIALAAFLMVFAIGLLTLYALLVLGWPPVIGNLTAAHAMREKMADEALKAYEPLAPLTPVDRFSIYYCHQGVKRKEPGLIWNMITVDLPERTALTRKQILTGPLTVR